MAQEQQAIFWPAEELGVEEDEQDFRTKLNEAELHGIITAQSILTQYELMIGGDELWGGKIGKLFPRPEIQRMAACFANVELGSHAPFYNLANEVLGKATDEFYTQWKQDPVLKDRIDTINKWADSDCPLEVTAALSFLEGAVLFAAFGFFKGFNSRGRNLIPHFVAGIDGSTKDENFHSIASAQLHSVCKKERTDNGYFTQKDEEKLSKIIYSIANTVYDHEMQIIDRLFEIPGNRVVSKDELIHFLEDRIDIILNRLGQAPLFNKPKGEISSWFYKQLSTIKIPDFFAGTQLQYRRDWAKHKLSYRKAKTNVI